MAKREKKTRVYTQLGLAGSIISLLGGLVVFAAMFRRWDFINSVILMPQGSPRAMAVIIGLLVSIPLGFLGFLLGLEGVSHSDGKIKFMGWAAFWIGAISAMAGIILALCFYFYRI